MKLMPIKKNKYNLAVAIFLSLIFLFLTYSAWKQFSRRFIIRQRGGDIPVYVSLKGEYACLPNRPTDAPVTLECALGLKSNNGSYYALDMTDQDPTMSSVLQAGQKMEVSGGMLYITDKNSWALKKYDIKGVLKVEKLKLIQ